MRKLIVIAVVLAGLWSGYWWVGAGAAERAYQGWFAERRADGWVSDYEALRVQGFPNRFDMVAEGVHLADPETGLAWSADLFQLLTLSYKPNHLIAVWPGTQRLSTPLQNIDITAQDFKASLVVDPAPSLPLNRSSFVIEDMSLTSSLGWTATLGAANIATRQVDGKPTEHELHLEVKEFVPPSELVQSFDTNSLLPPSFEGVTVQGKVAFDAPWDLAALEQERPQPTEIKLDMLRAKWGEMVLQAAGTLTVNSAGQPNGKITVKARNWREMVALAKASGLIDPAFESTVIGALQLLSSLSGDPDTLDVPLGFSGGFMSLGPLPIGRAPSFHLR
ncbi:DUF2125 domain-containing protein [Aliiroseovarius crassostreae]|uniref:DUF2125 domain-containing protein n=1 Tax=Aliiroseovarius crassostreae TaxID=154981 RepID=UPI002207498D|nr:DUF2125 domain-containing protein [Aliiroseovarius crassostreae]UWQ08477.1 DUF2125 domain-containing protein [Aliiroseovarius crassostreae]